VQEWAIYNLLPRLPVSSRSSAPPMQCFIRQGVCLFYFFLFFKGTAANLTRTSEYHYTQCTRSVIDINGKLRENALPLLQMHYYVFKSLLWLSKIKPKVHLPVTAPLVKIAVALASTAILFENKVNSCSNGDRLRLNVPLSRTSCARIAQRELERVAVICSLVASSSCR
jgi:hypothetical protein